MKLQSLHLPGSSQHFPFPNQKVWKMSDRQLQQLQSEYVATLESVDAIGMKHDRCRFSSVCQLEADVPYA